MLNEFQQAVHNLYIHPDISASIKIYIVQHGPKLLLHFQRLCEVFQK